MPHMHCFPPPAAVLAEPVDTREDPAEESTPKSESDVTARLTSLATKKKLGKIPLADSSQHLDIRDPGSLLITDADLPFQPFSAALCNLKDKESLLSPAALASRDPGMMTPLQQVQSLKPTSLLSAYLCSLILLCSVIRWLKLQQLKLQQHHVCRSDWRPLATCA